MPAGIKGVGVGVAFGLGVTNRCEKSDEAEPPELLAVGRLQEAAINARRRSSRILFFMRLEIIP